MNPDKRGTKMKKLIMFGTLLFAAVGCQSSGDGCCGGECACESGKCEARQCSK